MVRRWVRRGWQEGERAGFHTGFLSGRGRFFFKDGKPKLNHVLNAYPHEVSYLHAISCGIFLQNLEGGNFSWGVEIPVPPPPSL